MLVYQRVSCEKRWKILDPIKPSSIMEPSDWLTHNDQTPAGEREHPQNIQAFRESNDVKRCQTAQAQQGTDCGWIWITLDLSYIIWYNMYILQCVHIHIYVCVCVCACIHFGVPPFSRATIADPWPLTVPSLQWATSKQLVVVGFHPWFWPVPMWQGARPGSRMRKRNARKP